MPRERTPDQDQQNPGTFSPDDDEAQEADQTRLGQEQEPRRKRRQPDQDTQIEDEDLVGDEDDDEQEGGLPQ